MADKKYLSIINMGGENLYIKDQEAREMLSATMHWRGVTTTAIAENSTINPISIGGESYTAVAGDVVAYDVKEFIFNGTKWQEFGDLGSFRALAFADTASGSTTLTDYVTGGSNAESSVSLSGGSTGKLVKTSITPVDGTETVSKVSSTSSKLVTASITPVGGSETVSKVSAGSSKLVTTSITPVDGTETVSVVSGKTSGNLVTTSIVPAVSAGTVHDTPTLNTTSVGSASAWSAGSLPTAGHSMSYTAASETLTIGSGSAGSLPSLTITPTTVGSSLTAGTAVDVAKTGTAVTVATGNITAQGEGSAVVTGFSSADKTVAKAGTAVTVATGSVASTGAGAGVVTDVTVTDKTVAKAGTALSVATGAVDAEGTGSAIVTSVTAADKTVAKAGTALDVATGAVSPTGTGDVVATALHTGGTAAAQTFTPTKGNKTISITVNPDAV